MIDRDSRAFRLTEEGQLLQARSEGLLAELAEVTASLTHDRCPPRGKLRVSSPLMFGHLFMGRIAAGLQDWGRLPDAQVEVWALHASRRLTSARVAAFLDFLTETIPGILR